MDNGCAIASDDLRFYDDDYGSTNCEEIRRHMAAVQMARGRVRLGHLQNAVSAHGEQQWPFSGPNQVDMNLVFT